jgi:hypothetical protein
LKQHIGVKVAKEDQKVTKIKEGTLKVQVKAFMDQVDNAFDHE